jgi:hypothetical protein
MKTDMKTRDAMTGELSRIDKRGGLLEGKGAAIALPQGYVSGFPYLLSSDFNRAFAFKNKQQAQRFIDKFKDCLEKPQIIER